MHINTLVLIHFFFRIDNTFLYSFVIYLTLAFTFFLVKCSITFIQICLVESNIPFHNFSSLDISFKFRINYYNLFFLSHLFLLVLISRLFFTIRWHFLTDFLLPLILLAIAEMQCRPTTNTKASIYLILDS